MVFIGSIGAVFVVFIVFFRYNIVMQTYIIAGGAGFIGSHLTRELLKYGNSIIVIDNLITGSEKNIEEFYSNPNFSFINHDLISGMPIIKGEVAGIYHLASPASPNTKSLKSYIAYPIETLMINSLGKKIFWILQGRKRHG